MPARQSRPGRLAGAALTALGAGSPDGALLTWRGELESALAALPNKVRTSLERSPPPPRSVETFAEATWSVVLAGVGALGKLTAPSSVRDVAYHLAAHALAPGQRTRVSSVASQALVAAAFAPALDAPSVDLDDNSAVSIRAALMGLGPLAGLAAVAGTAAELASVEPPLVEITLQRHQVPLPVVEMSRTDTFDPVSWNAGIDKRNLFRKADVVTERFHDHLAALFAGDDESQYRDADDAIFETHGFRLIDVFTVLNECARATPGGSGIKVILTASLADALAADGKPERRLAAITALSWPIPWDGSWRPWAMVEDPRRLAVRPLLPLRTTEGNAVLVAPTVARVAMNVWLDRVAEGNWPLRTFDRSNDGGVRGPWRRLAQQIDRYFEHQVSAALVEAGLVAHDVRVSLGTGADLYGHGGPLPAGEIDVLALDRRRRRVLVLEAKHPDLKIRPRDIAVALNSAFVGTLSRPSDAQRAAAKMELVQAELARVLAWRGVQDSSGWTVRGAIVTPYGSPLAAWAGTSPLPTIYVEELAAWVNSA